MDELREPERARGAERVSERPAPERRAERGLLPLVLAYVPVPVVGAILSVVWDVGATPGRTAVDLPLRGSPLAVRQAVGRWRRRLGLRRAGLRALSHPAAAWLLHVATLWFWHAAVPYDAALANPFLHALEHASFLGTALLFWRSVIGTRSPRRVPNGLGVLLVFVMAMQSVLLSLLLTFAEAPWYAGYATTTTPWGLQPLADQQLAGVIMWITAGLVYLGAAQALLATWIRATERQDLPG